MLQYGGFVDLVDQGTKCLSENKKFDDLTDNYGYHHSLKVAK